MKKTIIFSLLAAFISVVALSNTAQAKRFGGGMSFGKSFSKQKSFSKPKPKQGINKSPTQGARSGTRAGGMMGLLGGLAMGGLLGAMFFGGGFEGINLFDILLIGGIAFAIFWFMRRASTARREEYAHAGGMPPEPMQNNDTFMGEEVTATEEPKPDLDEKQFLEAAKTIFIRMQADWDNKDMDDVLKFCTPDVAQHITDQLEKNGDNVTRTEVAVLYPELAGTWKEAGLDMAAVHFQATLNEKTLDNGGQVIASESNHVNEIWMFQHDPKSEDPTWYLAGIQQVNPQENNEQ